MTGRIQTAAPTLSALSAFNAPACETLVPPAPGAKRENSVAAFLNNAERQAETDEQRREIQHALQEMLVKSSTEL